TLDPTFNPGYGPESEVSTMTLLDSGKIMIGGMFTEVDGVPRNRIARLNADGSLDLTWDPGAGANYFVNTIAATPSGDLIVGGVFNYFDGLPRPFLARVLGGSPLPFAPIIDRQPGNQSVQAGENVPFDFLASGLP